MISLKEVCRQLKGGRARSMRLICRQELCRDDIAHRYRLAIEGSKEYLIT
jgi:hypothetical protein